MDTRKTTVNYANGCRLPAELTARLTAAGRPVVAAGRRQTAAANGLADGYQLSAIS